MKYEVVPENPRNAARWRLIYLLQSIPNSPKQGEVFTSGERFSVVCLISVSIL